MSVLTALYNSYKYCEDNGFVDKSENIDYETVLLPIYHSNKESYGNDIIEVILNTDGEIVDVDFLEENKMIIFPVTEDSLGGRTSGISPHPLAEEVSYLINGKKNDKYMKNLEKWIDFSKKNDKRSLKFLEIVNCNIKCDIFLKYLIINFV